MASVAQSMPVDVLTQIFTGLKSRNADTRLQSAMELKRFVSAFRAQES